MIQEKFWEFLALTPQVLITMTPVLVINSGLWAGAIYFNLIKIKQELYINHMNSMLMLTNIDDYFIFISQYSAMWESLNSRSIAYWAE